MASQSQSLAGPSNPLPPATSLTTTLTTKRRRCLSHKGTLFLEAYQAKHGAPNVSEKQALLPQVQAIPGCEEFTLHKLDQWFKRRKNSVGQRSDDPKPLGQPAKSKATPVTFTSHTHPDLRFPSLTQQTIDMLKVLVSGNPTPDQQTLNHWLELLRCNAQAVTPWDVRAFVKSYQESLSHKHLPTPEATVSPEPLSPALSVSSIRTGPIFKSDPVASPILSKYDLAIDQDPTPTLSIHQPSHPQSQPTNEPCYLPSPIEPPRELEEQPTYLHSRPMTAPSHPSVLSVPEIYYQGSTMIANAIPSFRDPKQPNAPARGCSKEEFNKIWEKIDVALDFMQHALDDRRRQLNQTQ